MTKHDDDATLLESAAEAAALLAPDDIAALHAQATAAGGAETLEVPVLHLFQDVGSEGDRYGEHAKGTWIDGLTLEPVDADATIIPVIVDPLRMAWRDRDAGGGLVGRYRQGERIPDHVAGDPSIVISDHLDLYVVLGDEPIPYVYRAKSTALKAVRTLGTLERARAQKGAGPGLYSLGAEQRSNDKGRWFVPRFRPAGEPSDDQRRTWAEVLRMLTAARAAGDVRVADDEVPF